MSTEVFTWLPENISVEDIDYNVIKTTSESKKSQYSLKSAVPTRTWRLQFKGLTEAEFAALYDFYVARNGRYDTFYWYHPFDYTTLVNNEAPAATVLEVASTMRMIVGDNVRIKSNDAEVHTIVSKNPAVSITLHAGGLVGACAAGSKVEVLHVVRFGERLEWPTICTWARDVGILFERDMS
jgi:phage-related protein